MQNDKWQFPQYRKYVAIDNWYSIHSLDAFTEIKRMGDRYLKHEVKASIYPEKLRVLDMLECHEEKWEVTDEITFQEILKKVV